MFKRHRTRAEQAPEGRAQQRQVFRDPKARADRIVRIVILGLLIAVIAFLATLAIRLLDDPSLPDIGFDLAPIGVNRPASRTAERRQAATDRSPGGYSLYGFVPEWTDSAKGSLETLGSIVDVLLPEWYTVTTDKGAVTLDIHQRTPIGTYIADVRPAAALMPLVRVDAAAAALLGDPAVRLEVAGILAAIVAESDYRGICLDFAERTPEEVVNTLVMAAELRAGTDAPVEVCMIVPAGRSDWPLAETAAVADRVILLAFDEPTDIPGPLAPHRRIGDGISAALDVLDPSRTFVALGTMGYEWVEGEPWPRRIDYPTVTRLAALNGAEIHLDPDSLNSTFSFEDAAGRRHEVWFLDAVSAYNRLLVLADSAIKGVALWPVGGEDPGIWTLLDHGRTPPADAATLLRQISLWNYVAYEGEGEFQRVIGKPQSGVRELEQDAAGLVIAENYVELPEGYTVRRWGHGAEKQIALTFDDGPDPVFTPAILDILREYDVPATFFLVGDAALENPDIIRRMIDGGHLLGSHTWVHEDVATANELFVRIGLNATQRAIAAITGLNTVLFRAPYGEVERPVTAEEIAPLVMLSDLGYVAVGMAIDPADWRAPGVDVIVEDTLEDARSGAGNVMVLHDAGGDRTQTVEALPLIIEALRGEGFTFVPLDMIAGRSREALMPPADAGGLILDRWLVRSFHIFSHVVVVLFVATFALGITRTCLIVVLALARRRHVPDDQGLAPPITVLVPAFCEETTIVDTVSSLLHADYPDLVIIVIDDGSTDNTYAVVGEMFGDEPRVRVVTQENQGKAEALNHGYRLATTDIVVAIDADTRLAPRAFALLVRHFADPQVGAVAGNVKVVNRHNFLAKQQAVEYITSQNLDRRAFETINAIPVVPGAIGAWRKEAVEAAGGLSSETLAEDADLTFAVTRAGFRIVYEEDALALTQAPQTVRQFLRQRFRWVLGMLQTAWKHRGAIRQGKAIGIVGVPHILIFGTLLPLIAPAADLLLIMGVTGFVSELIRDPAEAMASGWLYAILFYALFLTSDLVLGFLAFVLEPRERKRLLFWLVVQRFFYRQLLYLVTIRAVFVAVTGRLAGWRKIVRISTMRQASAVEASGEPQTVPGWDGKERRRWNRRAIDLRESDTERRARGARGRRKEDRPD